MKAKMINTVHLEGLLYEHDLVMKTSGENSKAPGTEFISGTLKVATDNVMTNIVEVHYTYVTVDPLKRSFIDNILFSFFQSCATIK